MRGMKTIDKILGFFKKEKENIIDFKRDAYGRLKKTDARGELEDDEPAYTSSLSKDFDEAVLHQLIDVPAEDKRIHEEDDKAQQRRKKRDNDNDSR